MYESKHYGPFEVVEDIAYNRVVVRFTETGYTTTVRRCRLQDLSIMDPTRPSIYGIGFKGVGEFGQYSHRKEYYKWFNMLTRCYNPKYHKRKPSYVGCSVCERWHNFQTFCSDLKELPGYDLFLSEDVCHLDKDYILYGNKQYSKETCSFLRAIENSCLREY